MRVSQHELSKGDSIGKSQHLLYSKTPVSSASPGMSLMLTETSSSFILFVAFVASVVISLHSTPSYLRKLRRKSGVCG